jgi:hypothetical protein
MGGLVIILLLLAGVSLCCLGIFLSLPATRATELPSAYAGAEAAQEEVDGGANAPLPDGSYPQTPAEEVKETDKRPISAHLLTMPVLMIVFLGASLLWMLMTNAIRQGAICSSDVVRASLTTSCEEPSFLAVLLL